MDITKEKILVTGGGGFLGSHIVSRLLAKGAPRENIFAPRSHELDLRTVKDCEAAVKRMTVVIHAAAITGNAELHRAHPADIFYDNAVMGIQLLKAAVEAGVKKFVTIGSATEYPDAAKSPLKEAELWDGFPEATHAPYSIAKRALLSYGQACRTQYGMSVIHLLMTGMYGPGADANSGPIPSFIERIADAKKMNKDSVVAWGTGKPLRDFLYIEDAAEGIIAAMEKYDGSEPMNIGSGNEISIKDLMTRIAQLLDFQGEIVWDPTKPDGRMRRCLNITQAQNAIHFKVSTSLEEGLKKTIQWYNRPTWMKI